MTPSAEGDRRGIVAVYPFGFCEAPGKVLKDNPAKTSIVVFESGDAELRCGHFKKGYCRAVTGSAPCKVLLELAKLLPKKEKLQEDTKIITFSFSPDGENTSNFTYNSKERTLTDGAKIANFTGVESALLGIMAENVNTVVSYEALFRASHESGVEFRGVPDHAGIIVNVGKVNRQCKNRFGFKLASNVSYSANSDTTGGYTIKGSPQSQSGN